MGAWTLQNQKFDFSISDLPATLRLSMNDFAEKHLFDDKILEAFNLLAPASSCRAARDILATCRDLRKAAQTTFGLDWASTSTYPRLKVYIEELLRLPPEQRQALAEAVCAALHLKAPERLDRETLAAICADFRSDRSTTFKTYAVRFSDKTGKNVGGRRGLEALSLESRCFYYDMQRRDPRGRLESTKSYKVYEVQQIRDFKPSFLEIARWLTWQRRAETVSRVMTYQRLAAAASLELYPVLCAVEAPRRPPGSPMIYFSLKPHPNRSLSYP